MLVEGDSRLVVTQLAGRRKCRPPLDRYLREALDTLAELNVPWAARWIPRAENEFCDSMT